MIETMQYRRGSFTFDVLEFGKPNGAPIILLHGFPANGQSWRPTAERLARAGYFVVAPEQRGYSKHARPRHRNCYKLSELVEDVSTLVRALNVESAHIIGHDWGGVVAWAFAARHPQKTSTLTVISTPHPQALLHSIVQSKQILLSWYMLLFQLPWLPEKILSASNGRMLSRMLVSSGLDQQTAGLYASQMQDSERLKGALNWYRALPFTLLEVRKLPPVKIPTLFVYGQKDIFLSKKAAMNTSNWTESRYKYLELSESTHWIPEESPALLADEIAGFIKSYEASPVNC